MGKPLSNSFFEWLTIDENPIVEILLQYQDLDFRMNDKEFKIYFKGFLILKIKQSIINKPNDVFQNEWLLKPSYYQNKPNNTTLVNIINKGITINNLQEYIQASIGFLSNRENSRIEDTIRQEIALTNNRSRVANDTDYFIVDQESKFSNGVDGPRFDLVAIKWPSTGESRKNFCLENKIDITVFELKYGINALGGSKPSIEEEDKKRKKKADMIKHITDFYNFIKNPLLVEKFKTNILKMFLQQASLKGFYNPKIEGLKNVIKLESPDNSKEFEKIKENIPIKFGFIIADFKEKSKTLKLQIEKIKNDFLFAKASFMGYGLYENSLMTKQELIKILNENHNS